MNFLRNKEAKVLFGIFTSITIVGSGVAFYIGSLQGIIVLTISLLFIMTMIYFEKCRYSKIAEIIETIDNILYSDEFIVIGDNKEGEYAVLESEIHKMSVKLREGAHLLQKEKIYLTDSIADISHQLRTPLTTINLVMSFLQKKDLKEKEKIKYITEINSQLRRIDWLISSLLKISKIDAGTIIMKKDKIQVSKVVAKAFEPLMVPFEIRGQIFEYLANGSEKFFGDLNWSVEALSNIIKNCMEHTPDGGTIKVFAKENILYTKIVIEDTGSGIGKEDLPHVFERFYRGKDSSDSSIGIGLALSRMIIQRQDGSIKVENRKSGGSRFIIKFYKGEVDGSTEN